MIWLERPPSVSDQAVAEKPDLELGRARRGAFEGVPQEYGTYNLRTRSDGRYLTVWVFFGRPDPTEEQLQDAQTELDRLSLPPWPAR